MRSAVMLAIVGTAFSVFPALSAAAQETALPQSMPEVSAGAAFAAPKADIQAGSDAGLSSANSAAQGGALSEADTAELVSDADLDTNRGGQAMILSNQTLNAVTSGNILTGDYVAGAVTLADSAFSNFTGLGNIAINTGAQVSLQSGVSVIINVGQ